MLSGWNSICSMTLVWLSSRRWNVTAPACRAWPATVVQATRSSGICSVISASNSRCTHSTLVTQWVSVSVRCSMRSTPSMNSGNVLELSPLVVGGVHRDADLDGFLDLRHG